MAVESVGIRFVCSMVVMLLLLTTTAYAEDTGTEDGPLGVELGTATATVAVGTPTPTPTPTPTQIVFCSPPPCTDDETLYCPDVCPGGCGYICATPTATPPPPDCVGDCDDDGEVGIDELVAGTNVALGRSDLTSCRAFDASPVDGLVDVNELVAGVKNAVEGCPPPTFYGDCVAGEICPVERARCLDSYFECCIGLPNEFSGYLYTCDCRNGTWSCVIVDPTCAFVGCGDEAP